MQHKSTKYFEAYPHINNFFVDSQGNHFFTKGDADNNAKNLKKQGKSDKVEEVTRKEVELHNSQNATAAETTTPTSAETTTPPAGDGSTTPASEGSTSPAGDGSPLNPFLGKKLSYLKGLKTKTENNIATLKANGGNVDELEDTLALIDNAIAAAGNGETASGDDSGDGNTF
jgi:hypothetical protein